MQWRLFHNEDLVQEIREGGLLYHDPVACLRFSSWEKGDNQKKKENFFSRKYSSLRLNLFWLGVAQPYTTTLIFQKHASNEIDS